MTKSFLVRSKGWAKIAQTDYGQNEGFFQKIKWSALVVLPLPKSLISFAIYFLRWRNFESYLVLQNLNVTQIKLSKTYEKGQQICGKSCKKYFTGYVSKIQIWHYVKTLVDHVSK